MVEKKRKVLGSKLSRVEASNVAERLKGTEYENYKEPSSEPARLTTGEFAEERMNRPRQW